MRFWFAIALLLLKSAGAGDSLPRVLIIGDSVYRQPAAETAKALKGQAGVVHATLQPGEVCNTTTTIMTAGGNRLRGKAHGKIHHRYSAFQLTPAAQVGARDRRTGKIGRNIRVKRTGPCELTAQESLIQEPDPENHES